MVVHEGHDVAVDAGIAGQPLVAQCTIVARAESFVELVLQGEVEGSRCLARAVDPPGDGLLAVPVFAHAELRLAVFVVHLGVLRAVALHHVEAEAHIANLLQEELAVGLTVLLHVRTLVVEVATAREVVARVVVGTHLDAFRCGVSAIVVLSDISRGQLVGLSVERVFLRGEVSPVGYAVAVVDNQVHDDARSLFLERLNHVEQLLGLSEGAIVIVPIDGVVAHALRLLAIARIRYPYQVEIL